MGRVFLLHQSRRDFDLSSAAAFGTVVPVLGERESPSLGLAPCLAKMRSMLKDFDVEHDYLLAAGGDQLASFLAAMVLADMGLLGRGVRWLRWDRNRDYDGRRDFTRGEYQPVTVSLSGTGANKGEWDGR